MHRGVGKSVKRGSGRDIGLKKQPLVMWRCGGLLPDLQPKWAVFRRVGFWRCVEEERKNDGKLCEMCSPKQSNPGVVV